jgi:hypothetical protein
MPDVIDEENDPAHIFGGDIFISRMTLKRKFPLFRNDNILNTPDMTPIAYSSLRNAGVPKYFTNFVTSEETEEKSGFAFPTRRSQYELDAEESSGSGFYIKGRFLLVFLWYTLVSCGVRTESELALCRARAARGVLS